MPKLRKVCSLDTETTGMDLKHGAKPFFISTCCDDQVEYWHTQVNPLTRAPLWNKYELREVKDRIDDADILVLQNPKFDFHALATIYEDDEPPWHKIRDTLMAGHLLCSNQPHDLVTMSMINLRVNIKPFEDALEVAIHEALKIVRREYKDWQVAKKGLPCMPSAKGKVWKYDSWIPETVAGYEGFDLDHDWFKVLPTYGNGDSAVTLALYKVQEQLIKRKGLWNIYMARMDLLPSMYDMECNGMTMHKGRKNELYTRLLSEAEECKKLCIELADDEIEDLPVNGMSNALRYVLFEKFSLKSNRKTKKGKQSADKFVLDHWMATLPEQSKQWQFVNALRNYRKRKTAIGYMDSYEKFWLPLKVDGKVSLIEGDHMIVYPSYNPTGTDTFRFSSQNPNAQQVSKKEETNTRYCFGPAPGREWWALDFSNLELRIPAYEANEKDMVFLFEHPEDPPYYGSYHMLVFDTLHPDKFLRHGMECKTIYEDTWYQWTKNGNFAVQYGAVESSGTADRAYHVPGAQKQIMSRFIKIKQLSRYWIDFANRTGYIETMPDKTVDSKRGYPLYCTRTNRGHVLETIPLSYHVQGTAMWIASKAMIRCFRYLKGHPECDGKIIGQVHDEILFDFPKGKGINHIRTLQKLMELGGDDVGVPLRVSISYHPNNWAKKEEY